MVNMKDIKQQQIKAFTRSLIQDAAEKLIIEIGLNTFTMEQVAQEAGIAKGSLYNYFSSKEELVSSIVERKVDSLLDSLKDVAAQPINPIDKITKAVLTALTAFEQDQPFFKVLMEANSTAKESLCQLKDKRQIYFGIFESIIKEGIQTGDLQDKASADMTLTLIGSVKAFTQFMLCFEAQQTKKMNQKETAQKIVDFFLNGVVK